MRILLLVVKCILQNAPNTPKNISAWRACLGIAIAVLCEVHRLSLLLFYTSSQFTIMKQCRQQCMQGDNNNMSI